MIRKEDYWFDKWFNDPDADLVNCSTNEVYDPEIHQMPEYSEYPDISQLENEDEY